jgi:hypothetical protein
MAKFSHHGLQRNLLAIGNGALPAPRRGGRTVIVHNGHISAGSPLLTCRAPQLLRSPRLAPLF